MIDNINVNYSEAMDQLPPDWYLVKAVEAVPYTSKSNTSCIKITNQVISGRHEGRKFPLIFPLTGKATGFLRQFIRIFKPDYHDGPISSEDFMHKPFKVKVAKSTYSGGVRSYLKITPYPENYMEPVTNNEAQGRAQ